MKIAVLGKGNVGSALGEAWRRAGHDVEYGGRENLAQAAAAAEVVVVALPWPATKSALRSLDLKGKVVIDCTNPMRADLSGLETSDISGAEQVAGWAAGARVVKAFNSTGSNNMENPVYAGAKIPMFYCGDDDAAKKTAAQLVSDVGFTPQDAGPLANARLLEAQAMLWVWMAFHGMGREFAFQIVKR